MTFSSFYLLSCNFFLLIFFIGSFYFYNNLSYRSLFIFNELSSVLHVQYMDGAGKIFTFLNDCVVLSEFAFVRQTLKDGFIDKYIVALAAVVRDVDREAGNY